MIVPVAAPIAIVSPAPSGPAWSDATIERLRDDLSGLLAKPSLRGAHVGFTAIDTATGRVLFARNANDEFQPASTLKLLVGSVALERLGPSYRFRTELSGAHDSSATAAAGSAVVLRMGADPLLSTSDLHAAAATVMLARSRKPLAIYVDASHFDGVAHADGWTWDDFAYPYAARVSAAIVDENVVTLSVSAGREVDATAIVARTDAADVRATGGSPCVASLTPRITIVSRATTLAANAEPTADAALESGGCLAVVGGVPIGDAPVEVDAAVYDAPLYAYDVFRSALAAAGATLAIPAAPQLAFAAAPASLVIDPSPLWHHDSDPLSTWLGPRFWIPSDNLVAETLLKEIGVHAFGVPGTTANGVRVETAWLRSIGVDPATTTLADGSGLSQYDRLTPNDALAILQHDWNGPNRALILDSLPVGGARGTIEGIAGTPAAGRVFAKTGSFSHVRALAGYLAPSHHGAVTFAFDVDDWNGDYAALAATRASVLSRIVDD